MDAGQFWQMIDASRRQADGDPEEQIEVLREMLAGLPEDEIVEVYEAALADPESMVNRVTEADGDGQIEGFQYVAADAWMERTGRDRSAYPYPTVERPAEPSGEPWTEEELAERFPKLSAKFA